MLLGRVPDTTRALTLDGRAIQFAADGGFLIAFDRDAPAHQRLVAMLADGRTVERALSVAAGDWRIEHVNAPYRGGAASDAEFARRRPRSEEHTSELQSLMRISYAVFCLKKKK